MAGARGTGRGRNGEIYNHADLRQVLQASGKAPAWRGHSDTETLLASFESWGIEDTLRRCVGMFAIALWDRTERQLHLMRDRLGEKPLYYGWAGDVLLFDRSSRCSAPIRLGGAR